MVKRFIKKQLNKAGLDVIKLNKTANWPSDFEEIHKSIFTKVAPYTMTSQERIFGLIEAIKYVVKNYIEGDIVECGVWKGGSMLAIAETLLRMAETTRHLYLYDTFDGMSEPTKADVSYDDQNAENLLNKHKKDNPVWAYSTLETVEQTM